MTDSWLSYIIIIFITAVITSIITENVVISRLGCSEGVKISSGKCRLMNGYAKVDVDMDIKK